MSQRALKTPYATICLLVITAIFSLLVPRMVSGLSVYDVIMLSNGGYEADDIVALIETTGSAFELTATDVVRLKRAGVNETVIQAMLVAVPPEPQKNGNSPSPLSPAKQRTHEADTLTIFSESKRSEGDSRPLRLIKKSQPAQAPFVDISGDIFASMPINEKDEGGHRHQAVTFVGVTLIILRDEGAYSTVAARASAVVRRLQQAQSIGNGKFKANHAGGGVHAVVFQTQDRREIVIISASGRDARAYQTRSGRQVNPDILADYWSDLLSDYWSIFFQASAPTRLNNLHEGEALQALSRQLTGAKNGDVDQLIEAVRSLPREVHEHLELLAATVPREFGKESNHEAEEQ